MGLTPLAVTDTRALFRPVVRELAALLRTLPPSDWERPTVAGTWRVRDVIAHLTDGALRRLSFHRDGMAPPGPGLLESERDFVAFINGLNDVWVRAASRLSPRVLTEMFERGGDAVADWFEALPLDAPALFPVSWAGEDTSAGWFDVGREFTELWHHQEQVRMAVGAPSLADPRYLRAVLEIAVRGLPHAFRHVEAETGTALVLDVSGGAGGLWTVARGPDGWRVWKGEPASASARVAVADHTAWKLLFNALPERDAAATVGSEGRRDLVTALLSARSVIV
jgi:uncharacterized protein (TIGR03083 family)